MRFFSFACLLRLLPRRTRRLTDTVDCAPNQDQTALPGPQATKPDSPAGKLASLERHAQTLQLALEVLSEWLASGLPDAASFDAADGPGAGDEDEELEGEGEEAWGGISMEVEAGDIDMGGSDDEGDEDAAMGGDQVNEADGVIRRRRGDTPTGADDSMLDDLAATAGDGADDGDSEDDDDEEDDSAAEGAEGKTAALALLSSLPLQLLALSRPTSLSFLSSSSFAASPLDAPATAPSGLISTSASGTDLVPANLAPLAESLTTVHVRATEALNNLYVVLSRAGAAKGKASRRDANELQNVFESVLQLMLGALEGARTHVVKPAAKETGGKKGKGVAKETQQAGAEEVEEVQERRLEVVMAGAGVVWGCVRLGLDPEHGAGLVR